MTRENGRTLRKIGMVFQAICLFGIVSIARQTGNLNDPAKLARIRVEWIILAVGFAFGFVFWLVGTITIYRNRGSGGQDSA